MEKKSNIFLLILGFFLPFIGAIISMFIKDEVNRVSFKRGSMISSIILFLIGMGLGIYFIGMEMGRTE